MKAEDLSFLSPSLRKVMALLAAIMVVAAGGAAADARLHTIAAEEAQKAIAPTQTDSSYTRQLLEQQLAEIQRRLDRIEKKLDR